MEGLGGAVPARVEVICEHVTQTVLQFDELGIQEVRIAVVGETEEVLQP